VICLAHDIGHPPFGHSGERTLNRLMQEYGGFEGNAQTLRMLTEIIYSEGGKHRGMDPSRALMDGILKYKVVFSELKNPQNHFIYDHQEKYLFFIFSHQNFKEKLPDAEQRNQFRSIEC